jgi:hypothetical protein
MNWGYRPADPVWLLRLQRLHADFRLSWGEKLLYGATLVFAVFMVVLCAKTSLRLAWPDRARTIMLIHSLEAALEHAHR